jgi:hypothetical protein
MAVVVTFHVYKIAERRYNNRNVASMGAILFAVTPMTWMLEEYFLTPFLRGLLDGLMHYIITYPIRLKHIAIRR